MAILRWSALPGGSRHHWGCDFDVYARNLLPPGTQLQLEPWEYLEGHQLAFYQWVEANLDSFGFSSLTDKIWVAWRLNLGTSVINRLGYNA